jgi:hypothetical protein
VVWPRGQQPGGRSGRAPAAEAPWPQVHGASRRPDARALNRAISGARHWRELAAVFGAHGAEFDAMHASAALVRLATLHGAGRDARAGRGPAAGGAPGAIPGACGGIGPAALAQALLGRAEELSASLAHRQIANIAWAAARLAAPPPPPQLRRLLQGALRLPRGLRGFKPQELANLAYALALLQPHYEGPSWRGADASGGDRAGSGGGSGSDRSAARECVAAAGPQATSGGGASAGSSGAGCGSSAGQPWDGAFVLGLFAASMDALPACNARDVAQLAYSLSLLRPAAPRGWLAAWAARAAELLPSMGPQALANSAYGVARLTLGWSDRGGLGWDEAAAEEPQGGPAPQAASSRSESSASSAGSAGISASSSSGGGGGGGTEEPQGGPGAADVAATRKWLGRALQYASLHGPALSARELIGQLLWAAGQLSVCGGGGGGGSGRGGGVATGSQGGSGAALPAAAVEALLVRAAALLVEGSDEDGSGTGAHREERGGGCRRDAYAAAGHVAVLLSSAARIGAPRPPPPEWQRACWRAAARHVLADPCGLTGPELCELMAGAGALGMRPPRWLREAILSAAAGAVEASGDPRIAARAAYAAAAAGWGPGKRWLVRLQAASRPLLGVFEPRDFANAAWGLATMGAPPDKRWAWSSLRGGRVGRAWGGGSRGERARKLHCPGPCPLHAALRLSLYRPPPPTGPAARPPSPQGGSTGSSLRASPSCRASSPGSSPTPSGRSRASATRPRSRGWRRCLPAPPRACAPSGQPS